jgi:ribosomal protein L37E
MQTILKDEPVFVKIIQKTAAGSTVECGRCGSHSYVDKKEDIDQDGVWVGPRCSYCGVRLRHPLWANQNV